MNAYNGKEGRLPQGLKPKFVWPLMARLKSCPSQTTFEASLDAVLVNVA